MTVVDGQVNTIRCPICPQEKAPPPGCWVGQCPSDTVEPRGYRVCLEQDDEQVAYGRDRETAIARSWEVRAELAKAWGRMCLPKIPGASIRGPVLAIDGGAKLSIDQGAVTVTDNNRAQVAWLDHREVEAVVVLWAQQVTP